MTDEAQSSETQVALFRYGLIADCIQLPKGKGNGISAMLAEKSKRHYAIPGTRRTVVAVETMRGWIAAYRRGGFDALKPKKRADAGSARKLPQEVVDRLVAFKDEHYGFTVPMVISAVQAEMKLDPALALPASTVHRILSRAGVMQKRRVDPTSLDHRRFSYEQAGELWMSDVMHGPSVFVDGRKKHKTYLVALIDDATRIVPYAAFALSERTEALLTVLEQAVRRRGVPKRLFVDNGSAFRSAHLSLVCAKLGVTLIHARPYAPQGKGKMERWFRTCRLQLLPTLTAADLSSLDALNRRLWTYIESEYHQAPHKGLDGKTPFDAWAMASSEVRVPGPELDLRELFLFEEKRKVAKDRTVSLHGRVYEVDALLVGESVTLRFNPSLPKGSVDVWHKGKKVQTATLVDAYQNCFVKRNHATSLLEPAETLPNKISQSETPPTAPAPSTLRLSDLAKHNGQEDF
jgi:transposase InsO family protein